jgi:2'-5' RNA ligase
MESQSTRCFICIEVSRKAIDYIENIQSIIKKKNLFFGKFTEPENLHLTLKFLGELNDKKILEVRKKLQEIDFNSFTANLGEIGSFSARMLRILWLKINGKEIFNLQQEIDSKLSELFKKEERFMSHLTIARIKKVFDIKIFKNYIYGIKTKKIKFEVREFILKKSELKPEGPVYTDIERYKLKN